MVGIKISTLMYNHALGGSLFTTAMRECTEIIFVTLLVGTALTITPLRAYLTSTFDLSSIEGIHVCEPTLAS